MWYKRGSCMYESIMLAGQTIRSQIQSQRPPFECIALLLPGGGALGSYQAGVYQGLTEADLHPDWVAGVSETALFFASFNSNALTGQSIVVSHGWFMQ